MTWSEKTLFYIFAGLCLFSFGFLFGKSSLLMIMNTHLTNAKIRAHFQSLDVGLAQEIHKGRDLALISTHPAAAAATATAAAKRSSSSHHIRGSVKVEDSEIQEMPRCPELPPYLTGPFIVDINKNVSLKDIMSENSHLQEGGRGKPQFCKAQQKIAIIIPFREREPHLTIWLHYMLPFLQKQQADFGIYVVEQSKNATFNRAKLMNVGYSESIKDYDYNCFIFSDVDIIPMNDRNLYRCSENPRHMANSLDKFNFSLPYKTLFGGIVAFTKEQFLKVNGFSNRFWGWGGEDDELYNRVVAAGMKIERPHPEIARSKAIFHHRDPGNERTGKSFHLISQASKFMHIDGLNSLEYGVIKHIRNKLYTKITVNFGIAQ